MSYSANVPENSLLFNKGFPLNDISSEERGPKGSYSLFIRFAGEFLKFLFMSVERKNLINK